MTTTPVPGPTGMRMLAAALGLAIATAPTFGQLPAVPAPSGDPPPAATAPVNPPPPLPGGAAVDRVTSVTGACPCPAAEKPTPPPPPPFSGPLCERPVLSGDWCGLRSRLRDDCGITLDVFATNFYSGVAHGGLQQAFPFGGHSDYYLHVDGQKAGLWQGLFIDLHGETIYGQSANNLTGALMPVSTTQLFPIPNGEVTALTRVKVTQALSENFVVFGGKINVLDEFNQPFTGGAYGRDGFMNTGMLVPVVALRGVPFSSYGGGFAVLKDLQPVFSVMVLDPNNTPTVSGFETFFDRGVSILSSLNVPTKFFGLPGHQGIGGMYSNSRYAALDNNLAFFVTQRLLGLFPPLPQKTGTWAVYYSFDQTLWAAPDDPKRSWGLFGNVGISDGNPSPIRWAANIGIGGASPFRNRKLDTFGVGYYYVGVSNDLRNFAPLLVPLREEQGVELFYNVGVTPWFHVTPDFQVIIPTREKVDTVLFAGLRAKINF
jgi:porin